MAKKKDITKKTKKEINKVKFIVGDLVEEVGCKVIYKITALTNENAVLEDISGNEKLSSIKKLIYIEILKAGKRYLMTPCRGDVGRFGIVKIEWSKGHRFGVSGKEIKYQHSIYDFIDIIEITSKNLLSEIPCK